MVHSTTTLLLLLSTAIAAVSAQADAGCDKSITATTDAQLTPLYKCTSFSGHLIVNSPTIAAVAWPSLKILSGSIQLLNNPHLTTLGLGGLENCSGSIMMTNNTVLNSLDFGKLQSLNKLSIITAPNLRELKMPLIVSLNSLTIEDSGLEQASGPTPWDKIDTVVDLGLSNNKYLKKIKMDHLNSVTGRLNIAGNGLVDAASTTTLLPGMGASLVMQNLTSCSNCTFRHLQELDLKKLSSVSTNLEFIETNLNAIDIPNLQAVGDTLSIVANNALTNISLPSLINIGGALQIANNTKLQDVTLQHLKGISGALDMQGAFQNVSLPSIINVKGGMSVSSSDEDFDCGSLDNVKAGARGKAVCVAQVVKTPGKSTGTGGIFDSATSDAADIRLVQGSAVAALVLVSCLAVLF